MSDFSNGRPGRPSVEVGPDSIAARLRHVRATGAAATDAEFAKIAGVSRATMSAYLNGHRSPSWQVLHRIAQATNVSFEWLQIGTRDSLQPQVKQARDLRLYGLFQNTFAEVHDEGWRDGAEAERRFAAAHGPQVYFNLLHSRGLTDKTFYEWLEGYGIKRPGQS